MKAFLFRRLLCLMLGLSAGVARAGDAIPPELVGIWANDSAVMKGPMLYQGQAVYLGADGHGALVAGPPPVTFRITASYDPASSTVGYDAFQSGNFVQHAVLRFDPSTQTLFIGEPNGLALHRRFSELSETTRSVLGF